MRKNNIALLGCSIVTSHLLSANNIEETKVINDTPTTEPFIFTNPYTFDVNHSEPILKTKYRSGGNNRKKVKRKKAKNGKR